LLFNVLPSANPLIRSKSLRLDKGCIAFSTT
jgi:hypothetical protein